MTSKKLSVVNRFGFYSVRDSDDKILFNATNMADANAVFKKFAKRNMKHSDIRYG
jgi:hypothetical protein